MEARLSFFRSLQRENYLVGESKKTKSENEILADLMDPSVCGIGPLSSGNQEITTEGFGKEKL